MRLRRQTVLSILVLNAINYSAAMSTILMVNALKGVLSTWETRTTLRTISSDGLNYAACIAPWPHSRPSHNVAGPAPVRRQADLQHGSVPYDPGQAQA